MIIFITTPTTTWCYYYFEIGYKFNLALFWLLMNDVTISIFKKKIILYTTTTTTQTLPNALPLSHASRASWLYTTTTTTWCYYYFDIGYKFNLALVWLLMNDVTISIFKKKFILF